MALFSRGIGIDLGTANIVVFVEGKGIVLQEPSVIAVEGEERSLVAVGEEAYRMVGRTPGRYQTVHPLREGVIADFGLTQRLLAHTLQRVCGRHPLVRPDVVVCVPAGVTSVERRAVLDAVLRAGARSCELISEPMAAALGAGLEVSEPRGRMVVDIGGGTTDVAVISMGGEVASASIRVGGNTFDAAVARHVDRTHNLTIGPRTAELLKIKVGAARAGAESRELEVTGAHRPSGLPKSAHVTSEALFPALDEPIQAILAGIRSVLERTPAEMAADIYEDGILLTGGGSLLRDFPQRVSESLEVPTRLADDPLTCVARGTGHVLESLARRGRAGAAVATRG
ncbi:rod shape-determining protein [Limnochorda pilosa]|uniref:Cell shape-determining protein MreB n=1 Tax=Limnochorda pilosa TaxID=1555112 RepID=A0A0K2SP63_LIMPI|nr:rod shape-determining protein [Limnochorda pilosa]BAS28910.1 rod shape-determining protein Mbl [Limnochorda pilosa]